MNNPIPIIINAALIFASFRLRFNNLSLAPKENSDAGNQNELVATIIESMLPTKNFL